MKELEKKQNNNLNKVEALDKVKQYENKQLYKTYTEMIKNPDNLYSQDFIEDLFGKTNYASRIFTDLKDSDLIENVGSLKSERTGSNVLHYKVIDINKPFIIKKNIKLPSEISSYRKKIYKILDYVINPNTKGNNKGKILQMCMDLIMKISMGQNLDNIKLKNRFKLEEDSFIEASEFIERILNFIDKIGGKE